MRHALPRLPPLRRALVASAVALLSLSLCAPGCNAPKTRKDAGPGRQAKRVSAPPQPGPPPPPLATFPAPATRPLRIALIGDYGDPNPAADRVAAMVAKWQPDLVATVGDNNYPRGAASSIDANIGKRYARFIKPYKGRFGPGAADRNRFFPSLGNHDWYTVGAHPYLSYFNLPGNERYYDVLAGPVHLFFLDSDLHEPDGVQPTGKQGQWLRRALAGSKAPFRFVLFHHPPHNTGRHGPTTYMRWPFADWGASLTVAGHDHHYERVRAEGLLHVVTGHGGRMLYPFGGRVDPGSQVRAYGLYGAVRVTVSERFARFESLTPEGVVLDSFGVAPRSGPHALKGAPRVVVPLGATWQLLPPGLPPKAGWATRVAGAGSTAPAGQDAAAALAPWTRAQAPVGRGVSGLKTTVPEADDGKPQTLHLRRALTLPKGPLPRYLRVRARRDDGLRVLVNGVEVWRLNLPLGAVTAETEASYNLQWGNEDDVVDTLVPATVLRPGANVVAVSLHQARGAAHDAVVDVELALQH